MSLLQSKFYVYQFLFVFLINPQYSIAFCNFNINNLQAFKFQNDYGGILSLGEYGSGEGIYDSDPMVFTGGDPINCGNGADRSSIAYWYCWYTAFPTPDVPLDEM